MKGPPSLVLASLLVISELAVAQSNLSPAIMERAESWKDCVETAAKRYAASNEPAESVARLAILSCKPDLRKLGQQMNAENVTGAGGCGVGCSSTSEGACVRDGWQQALPVRNVCPATSQPSPPCGPYHRWSRQSMMCIPR